MTEWNHNTHYHKFLLSKTPGIPGSVLDVGSGAGLFSFKLSQQFKTVLSFDSDLASINHSRAEYASQGNINFIHGSFLEHDFGKTRFDFIYAIASIHHMNFADALRKMHSLLKPGGSLIILGLYREASFSDFALSLAAVLPNLVMNAASSKEKTESFNMITTQPEMTLKEIKSASKIILGNYRLKRHLFWRYSLIYRKH